MNADKEFTTPQVDEIRKYRVVVSTNVCSAVLRKLGRSYFNHIFIDEASQAHEPEVMIPIRTFADESTNVIVAGDPKQLRPVIFSNLAKELGLEESFMERLMAINQKALTDEGIGQQPKPRDLPVK